jgi:adenosylcobinamide-GDP ribazoletransferase
MVPRGPRAPAVTDAFRLAFGTLTVLPVRPPRTLDRRTAGSAMVLAPFVGLVLGLLCAALLAATAHGPALLRAVLCVVLLALLTRGMHLDGLADTADGLGSGKPAEEALTLMRRGDVGPFGVVALVLVLLLQVAALDALVAHGRASAALVVALMTSRAALPLLCSRRFPAARRDGLGSLVAGSVTRGGLLGAAVATLAVLALLGLADSRASTPRLVDQELGAAHPWSAAAAVAVALVLALAAAALLARRCVHRLGGITGDVLGAAVEVSFTVCLVVLAIT